MRERRRATPGAGATMAPAEAAAAQCAGRTGLMFSARRSDWPRAMAVCDGCDQQSDCLAGAMDRREQYGCWGGRIIWHGVLQPTGGQRRCLVCACDISDRGNQAVRCADCQRADADRRDKERMARRAAALPAWTGECDGCGADLARRHGNARI